MMHVVELRVLLVAPLQRVPWQFVAAVVIDAFHYGDGAEAHCLADRETGEHEREGGAYCVEEEGFGESVVEGAEGVRDVDFMVVRVHVACSCSSLAAVNADDFAVEDLGYKGGPVGWGSDGGGGVVRYIHRFECMARCQKYCQLSLKKIAIPNRAAGSKAQCIVFAA